jgi:hypothetical protein
MLGFGRGQGNEGGAKGRNPAQRPIAICTQPGTNTPARIVNGASHHFDRQTRPFRKAFKLAFRPEPPLGPECRPKPTANAPPQDPGTPFAEYPDDEPSSRPQIARDFSENQSRVFDEKVTATTTSNCSDEYGRYSAAGTSNSMLAARARARRRAASIIAGEASIPVTRAPRSQSSSARSRPRIRHRERCDRLHCRPVRGLVPVRDAR